MTEIIRERRLRWLGYVGRMGNERFPKRYCLHALRRDTGTGEGPEGHGQSWPEMILFRFGNTGGTRGSKIELTGRPK